MNLHDQAKRFGIARPKLEYYSSVRPDGITVVKLTEASERLWAEYIHKITRANIEKNS